MYFEALYLFPATSFFFLCVCPLEIGLFRSPTFPNMQRK